MFTETDINELEMKKNKLEKRDIDLIISDFDDTIFCTREAIESDVRKGRRGNEGNQYIVDTIGIKNFIDMFYVDKDFPNTITSKLRENHDLILTAGYEDIQVEKIKSCKLNHINYRIVSNPEEKILETIKYIVEHLKFIPNKITVYEDRPKYFIDYKNFLEDFFEIDIDIMLVEMEGNNYIPKIKKIED